MLYCIISFIPQTVPKTSIKFLIQIVVFCLYWRFLKRDINHFCKYARQFRYNMLLESSWHTENEFRRLPQGYWHSSNKLHVILSLKRAILTLNNLRNSYLLYVTHFCASLFVTLTCWCNKTGTQPRFYEPVGGSFVYMFCAVNEGLQQHRYNLTQVCSTWHINENLQQHRYYLTQVCSTWHINETLQHRWYLTQVCSTWHINETLQQHRYHLTQVCSTWHINENLQQHRYHLTQLCSTWHINP